jgi:hypothetical protein
MACVFTGQLADFIDDEAAPAMRDFLGCSYHRNDAELGLPDLETDPAPCCRSMTN